MVSNELLQKINDYKAHIGDRLGRPGDGLGGDQGGNP